MEQSPTSLPAAVRRVAAALNEKGVSIDIRMLEESTRTAQEADDAIGCAIGQIVKSLVFAADDQPFIALVSGENRVDVAKLEKLLQAPVRRATAAEAKEASGFAIGGVPPLGHTTEMRVFIDETLLAYERVWAAAGHPNSIFPIEPAELVRASGGTVVDLKEEQHLQTV
jgi:prolyl-tRNA editing enzyme YbaK/EbsC (Cys-tRNA(Pro) deacylase)